MPVIGRIQPLTMRKAFIPFM